MGNEVQPAVAFSAQKSLEIIDHDIDEERGSDHEYEELRDSDETPNEEIDSDHDLSEQEREGHFQNEAQMPKPTRKKKGKNRYRRNRAVQRDMTQQAGGTTLKSIALKKRSMSAAQGVHSASSFQQEFVPSKPAWKGMPDVERDERVYSLEELVNNFGMDVMPWDGQ